MRCGEGRTDPSKHVKYIRYTHTYEGTQSGDTCSVGWGPEVEHHLGCTSTSTEKCLACLSWKKR